MWYFNAQVPMEIRESCQRILADMTCGQKFAGRATDNWAMQLSKLIDDTRTLTEKGERLREQLYEVLRRSGL